MLGTKRKPINMAISGIPQVLPADLTRRCCSETPPCEGHAGKLPQAGARWENHTRRDTGTPGAPWELCPRCRSVPGKTLQERGITPEHLSHRNPCEIPQSSPNVPRSPSQSITFQTQLITSAWQRQKFHPF